MLLKAKDVNNLRIIKTARDEESINIAAKNGFYPVVKKVEKSDEIRSKYAVLQNKKTGEIKVWGDYRSSYLDIVDGSDYKMIIDFTYYYPYEFKSPFAAYLIPPDIKVGERVFLEDLIEDYLGANWNQGDTYRLESCEAVWNGKDFDIQYDSSQRTEFIG